jgi:phosphatidylserine/phosphatidylglycerophosphate/cardiolipin synthase-like enzyme
VILTDDERVQLDSMAHRSRTAPHLARRARISLACAEGIDNKVAAKRLRMSQVTVCKWRGRFVRERVDGLYDEPRGARISSTSVTFQSRPKTRPISRSRSSVIAPRGGEGQLAYRAGMTYARELAEAGVRVLLYRGAYFHTATVCVDSKVCSIGSANMDIRSFSINYETNLVVYDEAVAKELEADFERDMDDCVDFSVSLYDSQPRHARLLDSVTRLASPLL